MVVSGANQQSKRKFQIIFQCYIRQKQETTKYHYRHLTAKLIRVNNKVRNTQDREEIIKKRKIKADAFEDNKLKSETK